MNTCSDCGSIIMEGDPYCTHCGAHLKWSEDDTIAQKSGDDLDDMLSSLFIDHAHRQLLKSKIESYLKARDCINLLLRESHGSYIFEFTRKNEFVKTVDEFIYDPNYFNQTRVFFEDYQRHNHEGLIKNPEFQKLIKSVGLEFLDWRGGYKTDYTISPDEYRMIDEIDIKVRFKLKSEKLKIYKLDLDKMKLLNKEVNIMWECEYCGEMNDDDAYECEYCGMSPDVNYGWVGENC